MSNRRENPVEPGSELSRGIGFPGRLGSPIMTDDFGTYDFVEGNRYSVEVEQPENSVKVDHHTAVGLEPQSHYETLEFVGTIGPGPWQKFVDWESEAEVTINAHHILGVTEAR